MQALNNDAVLSIVTQTPFEDVGNLCRTSQQFASLCATSEFWRSLLRRDAALVEPEASIVTDVIAEVMRKRGAIIVNREIYVEVLTALGDVMVGSEQYIPLKYAVYRAGLLGYNDVLVSLLRVPHEAQLFPLAAYGDAGKYVRVVLGEDEPHRLREEDELEKIAPTPEILAIAAVLTLNLDLANDYIRDFIEEAEEAEEAERLLQQNSGILARAAFELLYDPLEVRGRSEGYRREERRFEFAREFLAMIGVPRVKIDNIVGASLGNQYNAQMVQLYLQQGFIDEPSLPNMVRDRSTLWLLEEGFVLADQTARSILRRRPPDAPFLLQHIMQKYRKDAVYDLFFDKKLTINEFDILQQVFSAWLWEPSEYEGLLLAMEDEVGLANMPVIARYVFAKTGLAVPPPNIEGRNRKVLLSKK